MTLRGLVSAHGRAGIVLYVTIIILTVNGDARLRAGARPFRPAGARHGGCGRRLPSSSTCLSFLLITAYIQSRADMRRYELFVRFWRPDWQAFREVVHLGLPIGLTMLAEVSLFTGASLLMGNIGTLELAAHGIALQLASIAFMIPLGLAQAGTVRVGVAHGRGDHLGVVRAAWAVLIVAAVIAVGGGILFAVIPTTLASIFLDKAGRDSAAVLAIAGPFVVIAGVFQLVDGLQAIAGRPVARPEGYPHPDDSGADLLLADRLPGRLVLRLPGRLRRHRRLVRLPRRPRRRVGFAQLAVLPAGEASILVSETEKAPSAMFGGLCFSWIVVLTPALEWPLPPSSRAAG
jgi:hypothetical protein